MLTSSQARDQHDQALDDVTRRGLAIYDSRLKSVLEPAHNDEVVAIHVDSGDYTVAATSPDAMRAMRRIHPAGLLFLYTIGPSADHGLARRMAGVGAGTRVAPHVGSYGIADDFDAPLPDSFWLGEE